MLFCGITLAWDYVKQSVCLLMPTYIQKALTKHSPHKYIPIQHGAQKQIAQNDKSLPLDKNQIKHVQEIVSTLLYYSLAVNPTLACAPSFIVACQAKGTKAVIDAYHQLLDMSLPTLMPPSNAWPVKF